MQWILVGVGAALGGMLRLFFSQMLNAIHPVIPYGTLLSNLLGGFLMGIILGLTGVISNDMRLLLATGFLGGLTTFSTFSAESFTLLQQGRMMHALLLIGVHVMGSITATACGFALVTSLRS